MFPRIILGAASRAAQPHMNVGTERFAGIKQQGAPTDAPGSDAAIDFRMHQAGGTPDAPGTDIEGAQPHMDTTGGVPDGSAQGIIIVNSRTPDAPGIDVEGGQPHMDTSGGSSGKPTRTAPGNPDRGASVGLVVGIVLVLVLLLGGGGTVLAAKAGVFGCQFAAGDLATTTSMSRVAGDTCGASNTGSLGGTTATATPQPTATTTRPTATAKPRDRHADAREAHDQHHPARQQYHPDARITAQDALLGSDHLPRQYLSGDRRQFGDGHLGGQRRRHAGQRRVTSRRHTGPHCMVRTIPTVERARRTISLPRPRTT